MKCWKLHNNSRTKYKTNGKIIIHLPTKNNWKELSSIDIIVKGLSELIELVKERKINSVAVPPLGCGLGGLDWSKIKPLVEHFAKELPAVAWEIYEPFK